MSRSPEEWRRRVARRAEFDEAAAARAIRRSYRASGLSEPDQILWADGPNAAAEWIGFLLRPPRARRRLAYVLLVLGAALWVGLAIEAIAPPQPHRPFEAVALIYAVVSFYLARAGTRRLPMSPRGRQTESPLDLLRSGALVMAAMVGVLVVLRQIDLQPGLVWESTALGAAAAAGMLPGGFLLFRIRRAYRGLPEPLARLAPGGSVARALAQNRPLRQTRSGPAVRPDESLLHAYESAYTSAFWRPDEFLLDAGIRPARPGLQAGAWMPPELAHYGRSWPLWLPPAHFDGIAAAESASAAEREGPPGAETFADLAYHVDRLFAFRCAALAVRPPTIVSIDADGRPHAEGGPALAWKDGTAVYAWRGRVVDRDLVDGSVPLTLARINSERERERRSVLIERYGLGRFLTESAASKLQADACGALYRLDQPGEPLVAVRVVNGTAEPDGGFREFWLRVPPTISTAREAVAWTFGLSPEEYYPAAQS